MEERQDHRETPAPSDTPASPPASEDELITGDPFGEEGVPEEPTADGEEERQRGTSPRHQQISSVLTEMAKVARSFVLYDPRNEAIHQFLTSLLNNLVDCLKEGPIKLAVQPFELWYEDEVVYLNRDREKSLAFRFYRDGVRGLSLSPGFHWEELAKLLEVLSIRYTGVHQHEDDVVTLLWKANFANLDVVAVEGFVPDDDEDEPQQLLTRYTKFEGGEEASAGGGGGGGGTVLPDNIDLPPPHLPERATPKWEEIPPHILARLRAEVANSALPGDCLRLLFQLRQQLNNPDDRWAFSEISHVFKEVKEFLFVEEHLEPLQQYLDLLDKMAREEPPPWDQTRKMEVLEILKTCGDDRAVRKLLHSIPLEARNLNPELLAVIQRTSSDPFMSVLNALENEHGIASRAIGRQILEVVGKDRIDELEGRFESVAGHKAVDILRVVANVGGDKAAIFVARQCSHPDTEIQDESIKHLERMPYSGSVGRAIFQAFQQADSGRRASLLEVMERTGDRRFVDNLAKLLEQQGDRISAEDAEQVGRTMGKMGGERYLQRWQDWLMPKGWLKKSLGGSTAQQIAGAVALSEIKLEEAEKTLREALKLSSDTAQPYIGHALSHQRSLSKGRPS